MKKTSKNLIIAIVLATMTTNVGYALPVMTSNDNQNYAQNISSTQISEIIVTDDATTPYITAENGIKIHIPASMPALFDDERTVNEISIFGTAVTNGKVAAKPGISFEDKDKTLFIPVIADFAAGEILHVRYISLEGFNSTTSESQYLELIYDSTQNPVKDVKYFTVYSSTNSDSNAPEKIKDFTLTQTSDSEIKLTWTDPTDLDLKFLDLFRSLNGSAIDSNDPYKTILPGVQEYTDTGLKLGDTVKYQIRGQDGINLSTIAEIETYTITKYTPPVEETDETDTDTEDTSDTTDTTSDSETECQTFSDITSQDDFCTALTNVNENNIIIGYSDGEFKGENQINRAELLKIIILYAGESLRIPDPSELIFTDVKDGEWYSNYIYTAKKLGIIDGYPDGTFKPDQAVNKAEAAKIILKALKVETQEVQTAPYEDTEVNQQNSWYLPYAKYLKDNIDQNSDIFNPGHLMTRKEVVEMLNNLR